MVVAALLALCINVSAAQPWHTLGRPVSEIELSSWDIDVRPDGRGQFRARVVARVLRFPAEGVRGAARVAVAVREKRQHGL